MKVVEMSTGIRKFLFDCAELADQKNHDYHPDGVAYLEILQTAFETGITVEQDLWGRVRKQMSALRRFVIDGHVESEPPKQRMMDIANYMAIMAYWLEHKRQLTNDAMIFIQENRPCEGGDWCSPQLPDTMCDNCAFYQWLKASANQTI